jgi:hypothetical protein
MYLLVNGAVVTATLIQLARGYKLQVVLIAAVTFLVAGNLTVWLKGSKARAAARQRKHDYYAGL